MLAHRQSGFVLHVYEYVLSSFIWFESLTYSIIIKGLRPSAPTALSLAEHLGSLYIRERSRAQEIMLMK